MGKGIWKNEFLLGSSFWHKSSFSFLLEAGHIYRDVYEDIFNVNKTCFVNNVLESLANFYYFFKFPNCEKYF